MTRKKAIKTIMAVTHHGDKRAASVTFDAVKKHLAGNPSNATILYRTLILIYNRARRDPEPSFYTFTVIVRAGAYAKLLSIKYGPNMRGTLIDDAEA